MGDAARETIFYDGGCGLCHGFVLFVLRRDPGGLFAFAPLDSDAFREGVAADVRETVPDSVVVVTRDGRMLVRSDAALHVLGRLSRGWRALAAVLRVVPRPVRDLGYDSVARVRRRIFAKPTDACPVVPAPLRDRFRV